PPPISANVTASLAAPEIAMTTPPALEADVATMTTGAPTHTGAFADGECGTPGAMWHLYANGLLVVSPGFVQSTAATRPWYFIRLNITNILFTGNITAGASLNSLFSGLENVVSIEGLQNFNTSAVTSMVSLFRNTHSLTSIDVSGWNTENVRYMTHMFSYASSLTSLDVSGWDTSSVTTLNSLFRGLVNVVSIEGLQNFNTSAVTDMDSLFRYANSLTYIDVSGWNTENVRYMQHMFSYAISLTSLDVSDWDTRSVTNMSHMFRYATALTALDVSSWNTGSVTTMYNMFRNARSLTELNLSRWTTRDVTNMASMFRGATGLTTLNVSGFDTRNVTNMYRMFYNVRNVETLDVSDWNTSNVISMFRMFQDVRRVESLDVSGWDTGNVTTMYHMFYHTHNVAYLDVSDWDTSNVTNMGHIFSHARSITSLDLSGWDTRNVTNMNRMFNGTFALTSLDLSGDYWDTSNVTNMSGMFIYARSLTSLDASGWDTRNVTNMSSMFSNASSLTELNMTGWDTRHRPNKNAIFQGATSLRELSFGSDTDFTHAATGLTEVPRNAAFTGRWRMEGLGGFYPVSSVLMSMRIPGTWVWQQIPAPFVCEHCDNSGVCCEYCTPCVCAISEGDTVLSFATAFASPGDTEVRVHLRIANNPGFASMLMRVTFPPELTLTGYAFPSEKLGNNFTWDGATQNYSIMGWYATEDMARDGILLTLIFTVCPNTQYERRFSINATFENATGEEDPRNARRQPLDINIVPGEIRVQPITRLGDTARDGRVTSSSATWLARYIVGHNVIIDLRAADINCDGVVNLEDLTQLAGALVGIRRLGCADGCPRCR
ncbi:MAG: BspA family leucine-rich repeat surface protein, partial [Defluviitaleaceae bacterium]|nr:BspA family leucine-rich repeat surface protein [Defluviitaleaceae bacterium]